LSDPPPTVLFIDPEEDPVTTVTSLTPTPDSISADEPAPVAAAEIATAVAELADGRTSRARLRLSALWDRAAGPELGASRCAIAHWLANAHDDVEAALTWDERAVDEAEALADKRIPFVGTACTVAAMYPLLHLEVAEGYRRLGSSCGALEHLARARRAAAELPTGERGRVNEQIAWLDARINGRTADESDAGWERWEGDDPLF
jgi:hypothetical protein